MFEVSPPHRQRSQTSVSSSPLTQCRGEPTGVEFAPIGGHAKFHAFFEMLDELQRVLGTKVDLVMSGAVRNALIAREIEKTKRIIYGS